MKILSVFDPEFKPYGQVVSGLAETVEEILSALKGTPLPEGTGYLTDLGMTGPAQAVLGIAPEQSIGKFLGDPPRRYEAAMGACKLEGAIFDIDTETGKCRSVEAVRLR